MQLIVTCAGCGAKYRGESGPKKFRCAACSNLFTFPDQPKAATTGTILCSNCWTETVPTEKLKTCGFCSQRVSPRYGGLAAEDKQIKVKQQSVRNDPNLVKAVTHPTQSSDEIQANIGTTGGPIAGTSTGTGGPVGTHIVSNKDHTKSNQFVSSEWKEIGGQQKHDHAADPKKTQAFDIMAELKKEIEPEMQGVVESMMKSHENQFQREPSGAQQPLASNMPAHGTPQSDTSVDEAMAPTATQSVEPLRPTAGAHPPAHESNSKLTALETKVNGLESQLSSEKAEREKLLGERQGFEAKIADLETRLNQRTTPNASHDDAVRELQEKVAELNALVTADQRAKEQLLQDRIQLEELWRERDAKVAELTQRLNADSATRAALCIERDELHNFKRGHEALLTEAEDRVNAERQAKDVLQQERDRLHESHKELDAKLADATSRLAEHHSVQQFASKASTAFDETRQELEARIADLETRLGNEKKSKETLIKERDGLADTRRELQARIADLDSRLHSERSEKEQLAQKHDQHLHARNESDAKVAQLESRLNSEREAKDAASGERDKLHEVRLELEARTADLARRHSTEKEAKDRIIKEHAELGNEHRETIAKVADFKTRLQAEQDTKENVRKERDAAIARADSAEVRVEKSEAEVAKLRKTISAQLETFAAEYNVILGKLAEKTSDLVAHAALTRKRLDETVAHHGDKIENAASELKTKLDQEAIEIGAKLKKMMQEHEARDSARLAAQREAVPAASSATTAASSSSSGRFQHVANEGSGSHRALTSEQVAVAENAPSSSGRNEAIAENGVGADGTTNGNFWAKVFKRPQTKV